MQKRRLGQTGLWVSPIGLGTVKFGRNEGVKYPTPFALPDDLLITQLLSIAQENGINLLDTAPAYGSSEERLGKLLGNARKDWIIVTKAGEEFHDGQSHFDFSKAHLIYSVERSLTRLKTDYLDMVLVHSNGDDKAIIEEEAVFESLAFLKDAGKILSFGMSTKTIAGGLLTLDKADAVMMTYHAGYTEEKPVLDDAKVKQKGVLIKKALASGHTPSKADAIKFVLREPAISSVILGTINPEHLLENIEHARSLMLPGID